MKTLVPVLSFLALASGCGESVKLEELDEAYAAVACDKIFNCCDDTELTGAARLGITDRDSCEAYILSRIDFDEVRTAVREEQVAYDENAAGDCLDAFEDQECGSTDEPFEFDLEQYPVCEQVFVGIVENGEPCGDDDQCVSGFCKDEGEGATVCATPPGEGEACDGDCAEGFDCRLEGAMGGTCVRRPGEGEACNGNCIDPFVCAGEAGMSGRTCRALAPEGSPCAADYECESDECEGNACVVRPASMLCDGR